MPDMLFAEIDIIKLVMFEVCPLYIIAYSLPMVAKDRSFVANVINAMPNRVLD